MGSALQKNWQHKKNRSTSSFFVHEVVCVLIFVLSQPVGQNDSWKKKHLLFLDLPQSLDQCMTRQKEHQLSCAQNPWQHLWRSEDQHDEQCLHTSHIVCGSRRSHEWFTCCCADGPHHDFESWIGFLQTTVLHMEFMNKSSDLLGILVMASPLSPSEQPFVWLHLKDKVSWVCDPLIVKPTQNFLIAFVSCGVMLIILDFGKSQTPQGCFVDLSDGLGSLWSVMKTCGASWLCSTEG